MAINIRFKGIIDTLANIALDKFAGRVAWADKRSKVTVSGSGHTYNSRILLRLYRTPTGDDTYPGDAALSSVGVHYSANPLQVG
jgi:hypothetical protein